MKTVLKTAPTIYPVSLKEAKQQLNIGLDWTDDDDHIDTLIATATDKVEQFLHRRLITQTWYLYLQAWPGETNIILPFGKLQSVTAVKYTDEDGNESTWSSSEYIVDIDTDPGEIVLGYNESYPDDTLYPSNPIEIEFKCGYGDDGSDVDSMIRHAIKTAISDLYENRETEFLGLSLSKLNTFENLLTPKVLYGT